MASTLETATRSRSKARRSTYTLTRQRQRVHRARARRGGTRARRSTQRTCKHLRAYLGDAVRDRAGRRGRTAAPASTVEEGQAAPPREGRAAPPVLLAHKWETDHDPTGWWMSEKLDGIRAYWDGEALHLAARQQVLRARLVHRGSAGRHARRRAVGRPQDVPEDDEHRALGCQSDEWKQVTYVVFDAPNAKGGFEDRIAHVEKVMKRAEAPHARALEHVVCKGMDHLREELARVEALGGEGLMLRQPSSQVRGRPLEHAAQGQDVPRRRGARRSVTRPAPASTRAGSAR